MAATRLLITGGCGFIGVNLVHHLVGRETLDIVVFDNESLGDRRHLEGLDVAFVPGDIRDRDALAAAMAGADAVVHLAADTRVMDSIADPAHNFDVNVVGSYNVLSLARRFEVPRVIVASTGGAIVGEVPPPVHEDMVPRPIAPYGASKLAMEAYASAFAGSYGMSITALRFSNVYGPHSHHKGSVIAAFFKRALAGKGLTVYGDGSQERDFVFAEDIAEAIRKLVVGPRRSGVYQLGTGIPTSINSLIDKIRDVAAERCRITVRYEDFRPGEIRNTYCCIDKARRDLGFAPATSLDDGLRRTWEWFTQDDAIPTAAT